MVGVTILHPRPNLLVQPGQLTVSGIATGVGFPEPIVIHSVAVSVDMGIPIEATLKLIHLPKPPPGWTPSWTFTANITVPNVDGAHTIDAIATDDRGGQYSKRVIVYIGNAPLDTTFTGTSTFTTENSSYPGPYYTDPNEVIVGLNFDDLRSSLTITSFQPIKFSAKIPTPLGTINDTITITWLGGNAPGTFNSPSKDSINVSITLRFDHSVTFAGPSTITFALTTDRGGGSPLDFKTGSTTLVDDPNSPAKFAGGAFDGVVAHIMITGTISPSP